MTEPRNTRHPYWPDLTDDEGDALSEWFDDTCGDCLSGRCHWGGDTSRRSIAEVKAGREFHHPTLGTCGCALHWISVRGRAYRRDTTVATALAWRAAKEAGDVVVDHD